MAADNVQIDPRQLAQALWMPSPPPLLPDPVASGTSLMSQLLATLGEAGNAGDPADMAAAEDNEAERGAEMGDAISQFTAQDEQSSQQLEQLMNSAMQLPQLLMQSFTGLFQGLSQGANQAMQQGMQVGQQLAGGLGRDGLGASASLPEEALDVGEAAMGTGADGVGLTGTGPTGATTPAGNLGPPPVPSPGTVPMSARQAPVAPPAPPEGAAARPSMGGGMPMMPPGTGGATGAGNDGKADTKRIVPPTVKNGAPVQGRITAPQDSSGTVTRVTGKPVVTRRVVLPENSAVNDHSNDPDRHS